MDPLPVDEVLLHVRDALATDGRVGELGLDVVCEAGIVVVRGPISTETRKAEICALVAEVLGAYGHEFTIRDDTEVPSAAAPDRAPEEL